jgi:hypothetical protein
MDLPANPIWHLLGRHTSNFQASGDART